MRHKTRVFTQIKQWQEQSVHVVFAVVTATSGSTYSKPGDFIAIAENGDYQGLVSGGCVEGDLAMRAKAVADSGNAQSVDYDLGGEHDALWGMGAGCDGRLSLLLMAVAGEFEAALFALIKDYDQGAAAVIGFQKSGHAEYFTEIADPLSDQASASAWLDVLQASLQSQSSGLVGSGDSACMVVYVSPAPRVLICGAAPDVLPFIEFGQTLGWRTTVVDHRPAYIEQIASLSVDTHCVPASSIGISLTLNAFDAVMVMSHHLDSDAAYLSAVAASQHWRYVGLLGPTHRRQRLLAALSDDERLYLDGLLSGPAGLPIGANEPAGIALAIIAEMHSALSAGRCL